MIDHDEARLSLADLLVPGPGRADALGGDPRARAVCDECRAELAELRRVDELLRAGGPLPEPSVELERRIRAIAGAEPRGTEPRAAAPCRARGGSRPPADPRRASAAVRSRSGGASARGASRPRPRRVAADRGVRVTRDGGFSQQQRIALQAAPGWTVRGDATLGREDGRQVVRVRLSGLHRLADNGDYELWLARTPTDRRWWCW